MADKQTEKIREPQQKRSIEKKKRITEAGIKLIGERGYRNITTADIAKEAGVSTGIVYSYFKDKRDILIAGLDSMVSSMQQPLMDCMEKFETEEDLMAVLPGIIDSFADFHREFIKPHQELFSLAALDPEIYAYLEGMEKRLVDVLMKSYLKRKPALPHMRERFHLAYHMIEIYCHESVFTPDAEYDYDAFRAEVLSCIGHLMQA
ncbi:MAG: TetR/AcrR family transcriptional regulator [Lachnospiraceae bacterium]|nr:TetR/AcrR family transcriptional regulator [Lachnospiraceae bacterium]